MKIAAAADAAIRSHANVTFDRLHQGRLFLSADENAAGLRALSRFDVLLGEAETEGLYPRYLEGGVDDHDYAGQSVGIEVEGRSGDKWLEDFENGPKEFDHPSRLFRVPANDHFGGLTEAYRPISQAGRFRFNDRGIICGYRLNKEPMGGGDVWVDTGHRKFPDNVITPRQRSPRQGRNVPGKTRLHDTQGSAANDNFDACATVEWLKARMSPEHYDAAYDATAGLGFGEIGRAAGFGGKQAEAVGKDRVMGGLRSLVRLFADFDE